jgi:hypothetical protein
MVAAESQVVLPKAARLGRLQRADHPLYCHLFHAREQVA